MSVIAETMVVEDKFAEMFTYLPKMTNEKQEEFEVRFKYGDQKELIAFLKSEIGSDNPYPLIWLIYPFIEIHSRNKVTLNDVSLVLAVETNDSMFNEDRMEQTYKTVLFPLLNNIKTVFKRANIFNTDEVYTIIKYPNYSGIDDGEGDENKSTDIWDAIKVTFSCSIIKGCLKIQKL